MALHWVVRLKGPLSKDYVRAETQNLTTEGFYCFSPERFKLGERLECVIDLPSSPASSDCQTLHGRVTVLRVRRVRPNVFGIACRLEDYSMAAGSGTSSA
jgi:hypothetical protein